MQGHSPQLAGDPGDHRDRGLPSAVAHRYNPGAMNATRASRALHALVTVALALLVGAAPALPQEAPPRDPPSRDATARAAAAVDAAALEALLARARATHTDALVVLHDGAVVIDETFSSARGPIEAMSVTKSIVSLAIGHLIDRGLIASLDAPVHNFYPEWKQGKKKTITVRHLLNHTSGLQADRTTEEIYASPDFVQLALAAELSADPGTAFFYNNKAANLLAGVVERASGSKLDDYLREQVFAPLGITEVDWTRDAAGNPHAMSGLQIGAMDLAKLGQLMLDRGASPGGARVLSETWIDACTQPGQPHVARCGLLWWLIPEWRKCVIDDSVVDAWRKGGVDAAFIDKVAPVVNRELDREAFFAELKRVFPDDPELATWHKTTWQSGLPDGKVIAGPTIGFSADGYLGQSLVVLLRPRLVAVRQIRSDSHRGNDDNFQNFVDMVAALVPAR